MTTYTWTTDDKAAQEFAEGDYRATKRERQARRVEARRLAEHRELEALRKRVAELERNEGVTA